MPKRKTAIEGKMLRAETISAQNFNEDERRLTLSVSSEEKEVLRRRFFEDDWLERLGHKDGEIDLDRFNGGAPVLLDHMPWHERQVGVVERSWVDKGRLMVEIRLSRNEHVDALWNDIQDGIIRNVSIGYQINERTLVRKGEEGEPSEYRITRWTPMEVSFVTIPADETVGVGRQEFTAVNAERQIPGLPEPGGTYRITDINDSHEGEDMPEKVKKAEGNRGHEAPAAGADNALTQKDIDNARNAGAQEALAAERERTKEIRSLIEPHTNSLGAERADELRNSLIDKGTSIDDARKLVLDELGKTTESAGGDSVRAGEAVEDKFRDGALESVMIRSGLVTDKEAVRKSGSSEFRGLTLIELARCALDVRNVSHRGLERMEMLARAFTTSDLPAIVLDAANKAMLKGYDEALETWQIWCGIGNLTDFKLNHRIGLGAFDDLDQLSEDGEYKYGTISDQKQTIQLATFGKLMAITRQLFIDDDLDALTRVPMKMGRAAARVPGDLAYGVLTANAALSDGVALFHASHNNIAGSAGAPSIATWSAMETAMGLQTDVGGNAVALNISPEFMLVPRALKTKANVLRMSEFDPDNTGNSRSPNPHRDGFTVVSDARLDADSATQWYGIAGKQFDTVEVAFLDGNQTPYMEEKQGWTRDGVEFKVRHDVAAAAMDFRGMQRNAGA